MPRLRLHDLRHSYASFLVNSGRTLYEVQQILGHSDAKVTERYAHLSSKTLQEAAKPPASSSRAPVPKRRSRASRDGSPGVRPGLPAANLPEKQTLRAAGAFFRGRDSAPSRRRRGALWAMYRAPCPTCHDAPVLPRAVIFWRKSMKPDLLYQGRPDGHRRLPGLFRGAGHHADQGGTCAVRGRGRCEYRQDRWNPLALSLVGGTAGEDCQVVSHNRSRAKRRTGRIVCR